MENIFIQSTEFLLESGQVSFLQKPNGSCSHLFNHHIVCAIMNDGIGYSCYGNWRQIATNSYLHLQTISNDTCLFFLGFLKSHFPKQEIIFFMQQKKKRLIIFNYIYTNVIPYKHIYILVVYYSLCSSQYYETYEYDMLQEIQDN